VSFSLVDSEDRDAIVAEINVTPLTDLFLVLLIIFMVTSTALIQQGAPVNLPKAQGSGAVPSGLIITATADHRIEVGGHPVTLEDLGNALRQEFEKGAERNVILRGDRHVVLEDAVRIMTIAKAAGAERIAIATEPQGLRESP
jgi:biopolymer transport protein ExbD